MDSLNRNSNHRIGVFDSESERPQKPTEVSPWRDKGKTEERERARRARRHDPEVIGSR